MSIAIVRHQIKRFLSHDKPEVIAITGKWGVGKTYSWKRFLQENTDNIYFERYSYVSLFGIESIDALKRAIFENTIKKDLIGSEATLSSFNESALSLVEKYARQASKYIKRNPITKGYAPALESFSFLSLNKMTICIDDLERAGGNLNKRDILGLISQLKEEKSCKVVLLLNDQEEGLEEYQKHKEKVVDIELVFNPTAQESASIAYTDDWLSRTLTSYTTQLDIKNIRILMKIHHLGSDALSVVDDFPDEVNSQIMQTIALFVWCHLRSSDPKIPTLEFASKRSRYTKDPSDNEKGWEITLSQYNHIFSDELDKVICDAVVSGYFIEDDLIAAATIRKQHLTNSQAELDFNNAWKQYHHSLKNNQQEVIEALCSGLIKGAQFISTMNLNGTVSLLKDIGEEDRALGLIDAYISANQSNPNIFDLNNSTSNPFSSEVTDSDVIEKFKTASEAIETDEDLTTLIERISQSNSWSQKDIVDFRKFSQKDFHDEFITYEESDSNKRIRSVLLLARQDAKESDHHITNENITKALKAISEESPMNKRRITRYGIKFDEEEA